MFLEVYFSALPHALVALISSLILPFLKTVAAQKRLPEALISAGSRQNKRCLRHGIHCTIIPAALVCTFHIEKKDAKLMFL